MPQGIYAMSSISSFNKFITNLKQTINEKLDEVDAEIGASVEEMATKAKGLATTDVQGVSIAQGIKVQKNEKLSYTLKSTNPYSAYFEFGTGKYAATYVPNLDEEWQVLAREYFKNGKGTIPDRPFLYPSVKAVFPKMVKRINNILNA
jgi:hypothetical protein